MTLSVYAELTDDMRDTLEQRAKNFARRHNIEKMHENQSWLYAVEAEAGYREYCDDSHLMKLWKIVHIRATGAPDRAYGHVGTLV